MNIDIDIATARNILLTLPDGPIRSELAHKIALQEIQSLKVELAQAQNELRTRPHRMTFNDIEKAFAGKIPFIKFVRDLTDAGLKESKEFTEKLMGDGLLPFDKPTSGAQSDNPPYIFSIGKRVLNKGERVRRGGSIYEVTATVCDVLMWGDDDLNYHFPEGGSPHPCFKFVSLA